MQVVKFEKPNNKIERTHSYDGKIIYAEEYSVKVKDKDVPGVVIHLENVPYPFRILKGSIKGAGANVKSLLRCEVKLTGIMREYEGNEYFTPKDCTVTKQSIIAQLALSGTSFAGSLD